MHYLECSFLQDYDDNDDEQKEEDVARPDETAWSLFSETGECAIS